MNILLRILLTIFYIVLICGILYLIGWFLSNQPNMLLWSIYGKIVYLIFVLFGIRNSLDEN